MCQLTKKALPENRKGFLKNIKNEQSLPFRTTPKKTTTTNGDISNIAFHNRSPILRTFPGNSNHRRAKYPKLVRIHPGFTL